MQSFNIIKAPAPAGSQLFRIYQVKRTLDNRITVSARHIFYDMLFNFVNKVTLENVGVDRAIKGIYASAVTPHGFSISSDITDIVSIDYTDTNPIDCIMGSDGLIASLQKGELKRDNFNVQLLGDSGTERGFKIRYRKNLTGLDLEENTEEIVTMLKPIAQDAEGNPLYLPELFIASPNSGNYFAPIYGAVTYNDIRSGSEEYPMDEDAFTEMRVRAKGYFNGENDLPLLNAKVNFVLLKDMEEYKEFADLEQIFIGDTVEVIHSDLGVQIQAKCIKYSFDAILNRYNNIEVGKPRGNFAKGTSNEMGSLSTNIRYGLSETNSGLSNLSKALTDLNQTVTDLSQTVAGIKVNDAKITIQQNGVQAGAFTLNQANSATINLITH